jgi:protein phosphatase
MDNESTQPMDEKKIVDSETTQPMTVTIPQEMRPVENHFLGNNFEWISSCWSHVGCVRTLNEDAWLELIDRKLWVVADGMGGHRAGDVASRTIIEYVRNVTFDSSFGKFAENVQNQIIAAHQSLMDLGKRLGHIAGSTVVALFGDGRHGLVMWAGDSRAYLYRQGTLRQVTRDHSYVEELLARGEISPEEVSSHPQANVITRAVGAGNSLHLDKAILELFHGDILLLCSDGLYKELDEEAICSIMMKSHSPAIMVQDFINSCVEHGARDNVTVAVVKVVQRV